MPGRGTGAVFSCHAGQGGVEGQGGCTATIVATTHTHGPSWAGRALLYPRNIGFHVVHHLHPRVAMECLPALHAWYRLNEPGCSAPQGSNAHLS